MLTAAQPLPLSRRLMGRYLAFGLGGLLVCLVTMLALAARGTLSNLVPLAALGPLVVLLFGAVVLHQTVRLNSAIENELHRLSDNGNASLADMQPLSGDEPAVRGWNALVERLATQESLVALQQRVTQALQGREDQHLMAVINSLPDGIAVTDKQGHVTLASNALRGVLSSAFSDDLNGKILLTLLNAAQAANADEVRRTFAQPTARAVVELRRSHKIEDGVWRISRDHIRSDDAEVRHVWTIRDVTQQSLVTQARNDFVSTATHELRTPLANIKAYAGLLAPHELEAALQHQQAKGVRLGEILAQMGLVDEDDLLPFIGAQIGLPTVRLREGLVDPAIVSRIKVMAKMDIAEQRMPQDGRMHVVVERREIDLRCSTLPTVLGEKAVLRVLDRENVTFHLDHLGMPDHHRDSVKAMLDKPYGLVLATGPTGSGKTTTLYSAVELIKSVHRNIVTVEDPVEYQLELINQVQTSGSRSMSFANILRSILRQDPDVIMIGEIRDAETAKIAIQAAMTGHLVLSALHTNDSTSAVTRLLDMGIAPYKIAAALVGIIAQRLVWTICPHCRTTY